MIKMSDCGNAESVATAEGDSSSVGLKRQKLIHMFQRYSSLQVLEVGVENISLPYWYCHDPCDNELLLVTNFPSITSYRLCYLPSNNCYHTLRKVFGSKYLRCLFLSTTRLYNTLSLSLEGHCSSLQQLYINSKYTVPTEAFIDALCGHGGLEHVILYFKSLTANCIENIIEHSSNLVTFRVFLYSRVFLKAQLKELITKLRTRFSKRKLFSGANFDIRVCYRPTMVEANPLVKVDDDTDLLSIWESDHDCVS